MEQIKREKRVAEKKEETFQPKVNKKTNQRLVNPGSYTTGNKHIDLYNRAATRADQKQATKEELEYQRSKEECKFKPKINKKAYTSKDTPKNLEEFYGFDKFKQRLAKAREEAEFKKKMTERSSFAVTGSIDKAKKQIRSGKTLAHVNPSVVSAGQSSNKFKGFGGKDSA